MGTLATLPRGCRAPAAILTATQVIYPLCKRFTNYPQLFLGISFALGLGVGAGAAGVNFGELLEIGESRRNARSSFACMFIAIVLNTLVYDTIYGHQDLADDVKVGVKSSAVAWNKNTKWICSTLGGVEVALLIATSSIARLGLGFDILAVGGTICVLTRTLQCVKLDNPASCMWGFKQLICGTGIAWTLGLFSACIR